MRVFFIKDFDDRPYGLYHIAGTSAILWETTAIRAIHEKRAVPFTERFFNKIEDESQAISQADEEGENGTEEALETKPAGQKKKTKKGG